MGYTVIGMFEEKSDAKQAQQKLVNKGIADRAVDVSAPKHDQNLNLSNRKNYQYQEDEKTEGFWNWLFGEDEDEKRRYSTAATQNHMVTVIANSKEEAKRSQEVLDECGAVDVDERARTYNAACAPRHQSNRTSPEGNRTNQEGKIEVVEEKMNVGKQEVQTGGVQVRSRIVEKPVKEELRLREERVYVNRENVDRPASSADLDNMQDKTIEVTEKAERPVVEKKAHVTEEIEVGKDVNVDTEVVEDTVRKTEVDVDRKKAKEDRDNN